MWRDTKEASKKITCPACKVYMYADKFHEVDDVRLCNEHDMDHVYICPKCGILFAVDDRIELNS